MKRRDKMTLMKVLFGVIAILAIGILWAANYTLPVDSVTSLVTSPAWVENLHGFFLDIYTAISTDYNVLTIIGIVVVAGYYFLVYRPKLRK